MAKKKAERKPEEPLAKLEPAAEPTPTSEPAPAVASKPKGPRGRPVWEIEAERARKEQERLSKQADSRKRFLARISPEELALHSKRVEKTGTRLLRKIEEAEKKPKKEADERGKAEQQAQELIEKEQAAHEQRTQELVERVAGSRNLEEAQGHSEQLSKHLLAWETAKQTLERQQRRENETPLQRERRERANAYYRGLLEKKLRASDRLFRGIAERMAEEQTRRAAQRQLHEARPIVLDALRQVAEQKAGKMGEHVDGLNREIGQQESELSKVRTEHDEKIKRLESKHSSLSGEMMKLALTRPADYGRKLAALNESLLKAVPEQKALKEEKAKALSKFASLEQQRSERDRLVQQLNEARELLRRGDTHGRKG